MNKKTTASLPRFILLTIFLVATLLISSTMMVSAALPIAEAPTLWEKITAFFTSTTFSIVGQDTQADQFNYCKSGQTCYTENGQNLGYWNVAPGSSFTKGTSDTQSLCNGNSGLYEVWKVAGGTRVGWREAIDFVSFTCGTYNDYCKVELYCMPYNYPPTNSECSSWKSGYTVTSKFAQDNLMPLFDFDTNQPIIEYSYCVAPQNCAQQSKADISCWGKNNQGGCDKRTYDCTYTTYPSCPSTFSFTSEAACTGSITTADKTCDQNNGYWFYTAVQACPGSIINSKDTSTNCCSVMPTNITLPSNITGAFEIGHICSEDTQCLTKHCDQTQWYSLTLTCQPIPWDELIRISATTDQIKTMTTADKINIACVSDSNCKSLENDTVSKCVTINQLVADGTISTTEKSNFFNSALGRIQSGTMGALVGGSLGGGLCVGASAVIAFVFPPSIPLIALGVTTVCGTAAIGGALIGTAEALKTPVDTGDKNVIVQKLKAQDGDSVGLCVATQESAFAKYTSWAAFFKITGDKGTDGLIILLVAAMFLILILKR